MPTEKRDAEKAFPVFPILLFWCLAHALRSSVALCPHSPNRRTSCSSLAPRFQMRSSLSASGKPITKALKSLAKRRLYRLLKEFYIFFLTSSVSNLIISSSCSCENLGHFPDLCTAKTAKLPRRCLAWLQS